MGNSPTVSSDESRPHHSEWRPGFSWRQEFTGNKEYCLNSQRWSVLSVVVKAGYSARYRISTGYAQLAQISKRCSTCIHVAAV